MRTTLAAAALCGLLGGALAAPAPAPRPQRLLFTSDRTGSLELFLTNPDGTGLRNLSNRKAHHLAPAWSPDGQRIAFTSERDGPASLYVMDADGRNVRRLTRGRATDRAPAWSPDGGSVRAVTRAGNRLSLVYPAWSPDGKRLAFGDVAGDALELFACDLDGRNRRQLTHLRGYNSYAAWSADGKRLAFQHHDRENERGWVYLMDADGSDLKRLSPRAEAPMEGGRPAWQPR